MNLFNRCIVLGIFFALLSTACTQQNMQEESGSETPETGEEITRAVAQIHSAGNGEAIGTVTFTQGTDGVNVIARVNGLDTGKHGFHIHEFGDCTAEDLTSAGGHYNPFNVQHGAPTDSVRHVGDMGNLPVNQEGYGNLNYTDSEISLNGSGNIIGRSVVIHAGTDDFTSQPSGAAGNRLACGVIGVSNPVEM